MLSAAAAAAAFLKFLSSHRGYDERREKAQFLSPALLLLDFQVLVNT